MSSADQNPAIVSGLGAARGLGGDVRGVLAIPTFRRLWAALCFASLGDWLGLLALTAYAQALSAGSYKQENLAVAAVFLLRLAPAMVIGPLAGVVADRLDRRWTMVAANGFRFVVIATIPVVGQLWWLFAATLLVESASLFFIPAKEATVPNLVPRERLEAANQLNLAGTYGSAPVAAVVFVGLSLLARLLGGTDSEQALRPASVALYVNSFAFLVAAVVIARLREIPPHPPRPADEEPSAWRALVDGWKYVGSTQVVRGLVFAMLGAFAAAGAVIGLARTYVRDLGAGDAGYGVLFFAVFLGLALGMAFGPRLLAGFSRRRMLCLSIVCAGIALAFVALVPNIVIAVMFTVLLGAFAGTSWVTAYTLIGLEVDDEHRGRVFASLNVMLRVVLVGVLALAPLLAAAIGVHRLTPTDEWTWTLSGAAITMLLAGVLAAVLGVVSFRAMDDRPGVPLLADLVGALRGRPLPEPGRQPVATGFFLVLEGGEAVGKSTQVQAVAEWVRARGHEVVVTREPGGTEVGAKVRAIVLDPGTGHLVPQAEALLYAADRAHHVGTLVRPALERGAVVISDRYVDSSLAYQGAGRALQVEDVARISRWATGGLVPDLTVLLDLPAEVAAARRQARDGGAGDRLEAEPTDFHERVRRGFLELATSAPHRYLVVDATEPAEAVSEHIRQHLRAVLPLSAVEVAEQERVRREEAARLAEERRQHDEERRLAVEARRAEEAERRRAERERNDAAMQEALRQAAEQARLDALAAEQAERERLERQRAEREELERARVEQERLDAERAEQERLERAERERVELERVERERAERAERERAEREREEQHRAESAARDDGESRGAPLLRTPPRLEDTAPLDDASDAQTRELTLVDEIFSMGFHTERADDETAEEGPSGSTGDERVDGDSDSSRGWLR
ncbi:dTMP kinase [Motilibacter peucedani]|uniref:Thymidylate kinase n=1 Tax=Motilibacter peucedani TaxID=598650 RepID=A0A420XQ22_9ACTN|nr:dTMP kinase [Motilibacter peucedani]RKS75345.1 dTMP kinase [Motilibacter peucedani]